MASLSARSGSPRGTRSGPWRERRRGPAAYAADSLPFPAADRPKRARTLSAKRARDRLKIRPALITLTHLHRVPPTVKFFRSDGGRLAAARVPRAPLASTHPAKADLRGGPGRGGAALRSPAPL